MGRDEAIKRLELVEGSEQCVVPQAAQRSEDQDIAEIEAGRIAHVPPVQASPNAHRALQIIESMLDESRKARSLTDAELQQAVLTEIMGNMDIHSRESSLLEEALVRWLGEPESEADDTLEHDESKTLTGEDKRWRHRKLS